MANKKVQVQLLDEQTGAVIEDVDVLTTADCVRFTDGKTFQEKLNTGQLTGPKGATGSTGAQGTQGVQGPKGDTGAAGAKGATGAQGSAGANGVAGSKLHNVTASPATSLGVVGDFALNTSNGDVYEKTASTTWTKRGNFKGATGAQGPAGANGAIGPQGAQGPKGDTGAAGAKGATGDRGPAGTNGTNGATGAQGAKGDKGDPGDAIKVGTTTTNAVSIKLFFKVVG